MSFMPLKFVRGEMGTNFELAMLAYELAKQGEEITKEVEARVATLISAFTITVNGEVHRTEVGESKYKSALLILYLADKFGKDQFRRDGSDREIIGIYFPKDLVEKAIDGDQEHMTIYLLLAQGSVTIEIERPFQD